MLEKAGTPQGKKVLARILEFKRTLQELRRMSIHQREILLRLSRGDFDEIPADALPFYRDVYDHFLRINDIAEGYRDLVTSALDAYLSVQSNRMNEVMKTLTLMSTVMLPLTFIAGVYGMNFKARSAVQHAGAGVGLRLSVRARADGRGRRRDPVLVPPQGLDRRGQRMHEPRSSGTRAREA